MKKLFCLSLLFVSVFSMAQESASYKLPPKEIADLLLAKPTPMVSIDHLGEWMLIMERESYPTVEELGQPEVRVAGLRLNPNNFSPSRQNFINNLKLKHIKDGKEYTIAGIPAGALISNTEWSPSEKKISFTNTTAGKVDLYVIDIVKKTAVKINKTALVSTIGPVSQWVDDNTILYTAATKPAAMAFSRAYTLMGESGAGQLTKMVNQVCIAGLVQGLSEAIAFGQKAGLDMNLVLDVIGKGAAQSWQMDNRGKTMVAGKFDFGFAVDWMRKDLGLVMDEAKRNGARLPVTALVDQFYADVQQMGGKRWDTSSLIKRLG